jgi:hypothetical protein
MSYKAEKRGKTLVLSKTVESSEGKIFEELNQQQKDELLKKALVTAGVLDASGKVKKEK